VNFRVPPPGLRITSSLVLAAGSTLKKIIKIIIIKIDTWVHPGSCIAPKSSEWCGPEPRWAQGNEKTL
jgi:hypothetical protein